MTASIDFTQDEAEAIKRANAWAGKDPFPEITAALLNNVDALRYIEAAGILCPFQPDLSVNSKDIKPASIGIPMTGRVIYWADDDQKHEFDLMEVGESNDDPNMEVRRDFSLAPNSIAYVTLSPYVRLPLYIAARFNLTIREVYRGLLLGLAP